MAVAIYNSNLDIPLEVSAKSQPVRVHELHPPTQGFRDHGESEIKITRLK